MLDAARLEARIDYLGGRRILAIETGPTRTALTELVGCAAAGGYRAALDAALPGERERGRVLYQLLDDIPSTILVNGYAMAVGLPPTEHLEIRRQASLKRSQADVCAGWRIGGSMLRSVGETGLPELRRGPSASEPLVTDDPLAWHALPPLPPGSMRRARRIDAWRVDGGVVGIEAFFRDTFVSDDETEEIVHEYTVVASVDPGTLQFLAIRADVGPLPSSDCGDAALSATRLSGLSLSDLRAHVSTNFKGPTTCTHLNDVLRGLQDLPALLACM